MKTMAGNFFPTDYKEFPFKEGDLLASQKPDKKYSINKVLRVDEICLGAGESISIQGKEFTAPEKDCLLIVSMSYGENEFNDLAELKIAAESGTWTIKVDHIPNRAPGAALGQKLIGSSPVTEEELGGYKRWKSLFNQGKAGVF
ncbi:hypothetical protein H4J55_05745 [Colwellia sp. MB3u-22]|nr:hypothetical protein [Colwellia sp. MB02u-7]MBA6235672.1 hypothetical protein [Colwellia sp. MB02u-11]MBA6298949.1 hypothetical protein [Colwellia sp. MB3u-22]MBA6309422.1 hypothetical protein [Colwellia sp. MB3u-64]